MLAEILTENPLAIVALDRITDPATGDYAQSGRIVVWPNWRDTALENKRSAVDTMTHTADFLKFTRPPKAY